MHRCPVSLESPEPEALREAIEFLRRGELLVFPTETVYGITGDPRRREVLTKIYLVKRRAFDRRLPFVAADSDQAGRLVDLDSPRVRRIVERFWPGPLTLVLPLRHPERLAPWHWGATLAVRVPASPIARELALKMGVPLPATSANRSGKPSTGDPDTVDEGLGDLPGLFLDAGSLAPSPPSTLLDLTGPRPRILRPGAVEPERLASYLQEEEVPDPGR